MTTSELTERLAGLHPDWTLTRCVENAQLIVKFTGLLQFEMEALTGLEALPVTSMEDTR